MIPFIGNYRKGKIVDHAWLPRTRVCERRLTAKKHEGTFWSDENLSVMVFQNIKSFNTYTENTAVSKIDKGLAFMKLIFFSLHLTMHGLKIIEQFYNLC